MAQLAPTPAPLLHRQPLNLPAGSVRSSLVLMILLPFWILLAVPQRPVPMPLYVYFLLGLVLVFFASHGGTIAPKHAVDHPSPWYLPRGFFRVLLLLVTAGLIGWRVYNDPTGHELLDRLQPADQQLANWPYLLGALFAGYFAGWVISRLLGRFRYSPVYQDLQAAISIIAMLGLSVLAIIHILINPGLEEPINPLIFESILVAIVAWYFGARS
jgi:TctA family transporter